MTTPNVQKLRKQCRVAAAQLKDAIKTWKHMQTAEARKRAQQLVERVVSLTMEIERYMQQANKHPRDAE
jgi:hypothetical protein